MSEKNRKKTNGLKINIICAGGQFQLENDINQITSLVNRDLEL